MNFFQIIDSCLSVETKIDEIMLIYDNLKITDLLNFLLEKILESNENKAEDVRTEHNLLQTKKSIVNILILLLNKLDKISINDLQKNSEVLQFKIFLNFS